MRTSIPGLHHVTAIASQPQQNVDFYTGILGLRLVKLTVNFDDPRAYHLYYGDTLGHPGTILTFFSWPGAMAGRQGTGQVAVTSLAIPAGSFGYWTERLAAHGIPYERSAPRFGEQTITLRDPDGLQLALVASPVAQQRSGWTGGPVQAEHAIRGLHGIALWEDGYERTATFLTQALGFRLLAEEGGVGRYTAAVNEPGALVDVRCAPDLRRGLVAVGTVHHVAWRTPSDADQHTWRDTLAGRELDVTPVLNRRYFHSIYFREPGGVLFEIATDPPGFTADEPPEELGTRLMLPPWLETQRSEIERHLPPLRLPGVAQGRTA
jgi:glyoxalase family protein